MKKQLLPFACAVFLAVGAASAGAQIHITIGPPEHRDWAWHPGYHRWEGDHYVWVPGYYVLPPHPHAHWIEGHWDRHHGEYIWVEGHWR